MKLWIKNYKIISKRVIMINELMIIITMITVIIMKEMIIKMINE